MTSIPPRKRSLHALLCVCAILLASCGGSSDNAGEPLPAELAVHAEVVSPLPPGVPLPLYRPDSPWNQPIPPDAAVDPRSAVMVEQIVRDAETGNRPTLSVWEWSVTVYVADETTPRAPVELTANWSPYRKLLDVPIPTGALPDPSDDGHLSIIDRASGYEYDFWQVHQRKDGGWEASWGNRISLDSDGFYPHGMSARGSGFPSLAGMIWPEELSAARIDHALVISLPTTARGGPVWPATESDGRSATEGAVPEGAQLQLDPALNLDEFPMTPYERVIAEALQTYGAFVGDVSGSVELEVVNPISYPQNPYPEGWFDERWTLLTSIPWGHLRVLALPPQTSDPELFVADPTIFEE